MPLPCEALVGASVDAGPIAFGDSRLSLAHALLWSTAEIHTNEVAMAATPFGRRLATGPWVAAALAGIIDSGPGRQLLAAHGLRLGSLVSSHITYHAPIAADAVLRVHSEICGLVGPDATAREVVTIAETCLLANGEVALRATRTHRVEVLAGGPT
jgi:acyl dehydratase